MPELPDPFDRHLARTLADNGVVSAENCPDAEMLAAWLDRSLEPDLVLACERHVAGCGRCQAIASAVVSSEDVEDVAPRESPVGSPVTTTRVIRFPGRRTIWAVAPLALAATAVLAVWVARSARETPQTPVVSDSTGAATIASTPERREAAAPQADTFTRAERTDAKQPATSADERAEQPTSNEKAETVRQESVEARDQARAVPPPAAPAPAAAPAAPAPESKQAEEGSAKAANTQAFGERPRALAESVTAQVVVVTSPSSPRTWRFFPDGRIVRSDDRRETEAAVEIAATGDHLLAGAAFSDTVAWAVGTAGAVWRTTDGRAWERINPPAPNDFVAVTTTGADAAVVTSSTGVRYATTDGGRNWSQPAR